ncbi:N-(5'-phosphoribosyl)anthranilate isomerase, partial [Amylibacter sp.]|nr:N-(5'-phosphoribosyl)anthranilate isomerase [Amylibacter sp.]
PWMLAGGLNPDNLLEAAKLTGATQFDVSSGVETSSGVKDIKLISDFIQAANGEL